MQSSLRFVPVCFLLVFAIITVPLWTVKADECTTLYDKFAKGRVHLVTMLRSGMLIITKDNLPLVYDIPANKVMTNSVDLYQVKPETLDKKWPVMINDHNFKNYAMKIINGVDSGSSFTNRTNEKGVYMFVFVYGGHKDADGTNYISTCHCILGQGNCSTEDFAIEDNSFFHDKGYVSSDEIGAFYNIFTDLGTYQLHKYVRKDNVLQTEWCVNMCPSIHDGTLIISFNATQCAQFDWKIVNAFAYEDHFYLFGNDHLYIFKYRTEGIVGPKVVVTKVDLRNYFQCTEPTSVPTFSTRLSTTPSTSLTSTTDEVPVHSPHFTRFTSKPTTPHTKLHNQTNGTIRISTSYSTKDIVLFSLVLLLLVVLASICSWSVLTSEGRSESVPTAALGPSLQIERSYFSKSKCRSVCEVSKKIVESSIEMPSNEMDNLQEESKVGSKEQISSAFCQESKVDPRDKVSSVNGQESALV